METLLNLQYCIVVKKIRILQMKNRDQRSETVVKVKKKPSLLLHNIKMFAYCLFASSAL